MTYTTPSNETVAESFAQGTPTKGQTDFAAQIVKEFDQALTEGMDMNNSTEIGYALDDIVSTYDVTKLLATFRDLTGNSTEDVDHAAAVVFSAASLAWETLSNDYGTYLNEN